MKRVPEDHPWWKEKFDDSAPLVLTHQDINPRNIIVGTDGRIWMLDFGWAGYYPPWFEYVAMVRQAENERVIGSDHKFWEPLIPFICGPYFRQEYWSKRVMKVMHYG
jgi:aminoglycoside phosphotransferase (APT) family kinase protein